MDKLKKGRDYGLIGSLLYFGSFLPNIGFVLYIASIILLIVAVKNISEFLEKRNIFKDYVKSIIVIILGSFISIVLLIGGFGVLILSDTNYLENSIQVLLNAVKNNSLSMILITSGIIVLWVSFIIWAYFVKRSFVEISNSLNIKEFKKAAEFYMLGSILLIILVGFIFSLIGSILQAIAFYEIDIKKISQNT